MGTCYNVDLTIKKGSNTRRIITLTNKFIKEYEDAEFDTEYYNMRTLEGCIKCLLTDRSYYVYKEKEEIIYSTGFDASYGWEITLNDWFNAIAPALKAESRIKIFPEFGCLALKVDEKGNVVDISNEIEWDDEED